MSIKHRLKCILQLIDGKCCVSYIHIIHLLINTNSSTSLLDVSLAEVFEEVLEIVSYMTFFSPTISLDMWSLWPLMMEALSEWAIDFFSSELILIFYSQSFFKDYLFYVLSCSSLTGFTDYLPICLVYC